ncbi:C2 family repressor [Trabulsiella guamensis ATCC 49490]|uniref:C2 family repressor n=1 Tax=Trabulsiella guamensis ATCC 49490 TaxID=1005994 RepID=A0A085ASF0_9ENTR|nr:S24 family peptidase [Trabulsiella guamensis]KFC13145.1 C2 family repressor [Trabulsiella guamensis ATCC 49490]
MNMSDRIRQRRKELKLTQQSLAELTGVNRVTVTGWESDGYQPNGMNLQALAIALQCDPLWLVNGEGSPEQKTNLKPEIFTVKKVPLISWVQAGAWTMTDPGINEGEADEWVYTTSIVSKMAFALRVRGDSMTNPHGAPSIPEGSIVIVEPDIMDTGQINGKIVVAHIDGGQEATLKKFVEDWPNRYLIPLNPNFKAIECGENCRIVGLVKQVIMDF